MNPARSDSMRVLLVDDEDDLLFCLAMGLEDRGYRVESCRSGADALEVLANFAPHVMLIDLLMPEMDGWELCARVKANDVTKHIPVIFLTASPPGEFRERIAAHGAAEILHKPLSFADLTHVLDRYGNRDELM